MFNVHFEFYSFFSVFTMQDKNDLDTTFIERQHNMPFRAHRMSNILLSSFDLTFVSFLMSVIYWRWPRYFILTTITFFREVCVITCVSLVLQKRCVICMNQLSLWVAEFVHYTGLLVQRYSSHDYIYLYIQYGMINSADPCYISWSVRSCNFKSCTKYFKI